MRVLPESIWQVSACIAAIAAAAVPAPAAIAAGELLPAGLVGKFRGNLVAANGGSGGAFSVAIDATEDSFTVRWPPQISVTFEPADRPGVFRATVESKPLSGVPAYWARLHEAQLIVYELQVDEHGGYDIRNYGYTSAAGGLELVVHRIRSGADPAVSRGRLVRYEG